MNQAFDWTDDRVETLKSLWADSGLSASTIAERIGAPTRNTVLGKIFRLGLSRPRPPPAPRPPRVRRRAKFRPPAVEQPSPKRAPVTLPAPAILVALMELTNESCRWIVSGDGPPFTFCGAAEADFRHGVAYCRVHARMAYRRPGEREAA